MPVLLFFTFLFVGVGQAHSQDRKHISINALARVETKLISLSNLGMKAATNEMLRLLTAAQQQGALSLENPSIPRVDDNVGVTIQSHAEFGSSSSGWRITGAVPATSINLNVSLTEVPSARSSYVAVQARLRNPVEVFGVRSSSVSATLYYWANENKALLKVRFDGMAGEDVIKISAGSRWQEQMERVYEIDLNRNLFESTNWTTLSFVRESNGCNILLGPHDGSAG